MIPVTTEQYPLAIPCIHYSVINKRLSDWTEYNHNIDKSQSGFWRGYFAVYNVFGIQTIV